MVASRWPLRPGRARAVSISRLTSSPVRYSRGRTAALVERRGVTVRFSMVGPFLRFTQGNRVNGRSLGLADEELEVGGVPAGALAPVLERDGRFGVTQQ